MVKSNVTSEDVARRAGVSQSAVSRVFTSGASVAQKTRDKILEAAGELGYRPNALARSLITGRSRMIGLVVAYLENLFYPEAIEKLSKQLQDRGYHVLVFMAKQTDADVDDVLAEFLDYQVDGLVIVSVSLSTDLATRCQDANIPVVLFNRTQDDDRLSSVVTDNFEGGRKVADLLIAGGHRRIGYIAGWEEASTQRDREAGFTAGLRAAGLELTARGVGNYRYEDARDAARAMLAAQEGLDDLDAIFVANDHMAIAVMDVLRLELGLCIPEDISVVGFDDAPPAAWPSYDLTTVRQSADDMGAETVRTLLDHIENGDLASRRVALEAKLVIRSSARLPKGWTV